MTSTVNVNLIVDDKGTLKANTNQAEQLNSSITKAAAGAKAYSKAMASAKKMSAPVSDREEYDIARSGVGTGAAGRDFAKQSQGLGGLVRLYATFAANIFAVSAAFNALSRAQDTTNLVKGLDQLGAASGRNLGTVAQDIVKVTDGAVSLREAMTATAQASAAGLSNVDISRLAKGAKNAAQALGLDMSDALSRLSRGVTKLEPELLDELGIFVRVDKAAQDYARSVGKSALALTDVEKRAAFANAVLSQVEQKFGSLDIPSNPYSKLLASLKNVIQGGLEVVNTVVAPLVGLLSSSPTALGLALTGIVGILLKQAIPTITDFRAGIKAAKEESLEVARAAKESSDNLKKLRVGQLESRFSDSAKKAIADADAAEASAAKAVAAAAKDINSKPIQSLKRAFAVEGTSIDSETLDRANASAKRYLETAKKLTGEEQKAALAKANALSAMTTQITAAKALAQEAERQSISEVSRLTTRQTLLGRIFSLEANIDAIALRRERAATSRNIVSTAVDDAQVLGLSGGMKRLAADTFKAENNLSAFGKATTLVSGTMAVVTTRLGILLNALSPYLMILGLITTALAVFGPKLSANAKEAEAADEAFNSLNESIKNAGRTMEVVSKLDPLQKLSTESIVARSNALADLSSALVKTFEKAQQEIETRNWFDSTTNFFSSLVGSSTEQKLSKGLSDAIYGAIQLASAGITQSKELQDLKAVLNIGDGASYKEVTEAVKGFSGAQSELIGRVSKLNEVQKSSAMQLQGLKAAFDTAGKSVREFTAAQSVKDPQAKIALEGLSAMAELGKSLEKPIDSLEEIRKILTDTSKIALFDVRYQESLLKTGIELDNLAESYKTNKEQVRQLREELAKLKEVDPRAPKISASGNSQIVPTASEIQKAVDEQRIAISIKEQDIQKLNQVNDSLVVKMDTALKGVTEAQRRSTLDNLSKLANVLSAGFAKGAIEVQRAGIEGISNTVGGIREAARLSRAETGIQIAQVKASIDLTKAITNNSLKVEILSLELKKAATIAAFAGEDRALLNKSLAPINARIDALNAGRDIINNGNSARALKAAVDGAGDNPELVKELSALSGTVASLAGAQAQLAQLGSALKASEFKEEAQVNTATAQRKNRGLDSEKQRLELEREALNMRRGINISEEEYGKNLLRINTEINKIEFSKIENTNKALVDNANLAKKLPKANTKNIDEGITEVNETAAASRLAQERKTAAEVLKIQIDGITAKINEEAKYNKMVADASNSSAKIALDTKEAQAQSALELLTIEESLGRVGAETFRQKKLALDLEILSTQTAKSKLDSEIAARERITELERDRDIARKTAAAQNVEVDPAVLARYEQAIALENARLREQIELLELNQRFKEQSIKLSSSMTEQQKAFEKSFEDSVGNMTDALVEFAFTGKQSFGDMVQSMIMDLVKLEIKLIATEALKNAGGFSGIFGKLGGLITGSSSAAALPSATGAFGVGPTGFAKGGAFSGGVQKFAKGDTFTNRIVTSPTLFKFAKGTGMMGEAGPEAIVPLKRDSKGNLGVSTETNVQKPIIVHNNFTINGPTDRRSQQQIAMAAGLGAQRAISRNN